MVTNPTISVLLIDDQAMLRAAFRSLLEQVPYLRVVGDAGDARSGIEQARRLRPDLAIVDVTMAGMSGLDAIAPLKKASPHTRVLIASQHEGAAIVQQALEAGADGYLSKDSEPEELALAIRSIHRGDAYLSPKVASSVMARASAHSPATATGGALAPLSAREREVFQLLALGKANKEVAAMLGLSIGTVKKHRENLQRKLDCHSAAELARLAIREGLLDA
jgi:DNA-binding NarL/FixJ family response regulator